MPALNLVHRVRIPPNIHIPAPAVVMVHGWLGSENVMWAFASALPRHALAISMRAPFDSGGGYGWTNPAREAGTFEQGLGALKEFVRGLPGAFPVDPQRVALMGFSQGAAMSYALVLDDPTTAAAVAALSGDLPEPARRWVSAGRLAGKRVFIAHGTDDNVVPLEEAMAAREAMLLCGAQVEFHEYNIGHKLSAQGMRDLKSWLTEFAA